MTGSQRSDKNNRNTLSVQSSLKQSSSSLAQGMCNKEELNYNITIVTGILPFVVQLCHIKKSTEIALGIKDEVGNVAGVFEEEESTATDKKI